jgi:hypothetical protein
MAELINRIDGYLDIQSKKERIEESLYISSDIKEVVELISKSNNKEGILKLLDKGIREEVEKLIEGGLL